MRILTEMAVLFLATVTHAAHSFNAMGCMAKFAAQAGNMNVNRAFVSFKLVAPHRRKKLFTRADAAYIEEKVLEDTVFKGRKFKRFAIDGNTSALLVEADTVSGISSSFSASSASASRLRSLSIAKGTRSPVAV